MLLRNRIQLGLLPNDTLPYGPAFLERCSSLMDDDVGGILVAPTMPTVEGRPFSPSRADHPYLRITSGWSRVVQLRWYSVIRTCLLPAGARASSSRPHRWSSLLLAAGELQLVAWLCNRQRLLGTYLSAVAGILLSSAPTSIAIHQTPKPFQRRVHASGIPSQPWLTKLPPLSWTSELPTYLPAF